MKNQRRRGFTLIELLVVISIIAILTVVGIVSYQTANRNARNARRQSDIEQVRAAIEVYRTEEGSYPTGTFDQVITLLYGGDYLSVSELRDPRYPASGFVYTYNTTGSTYLVCKNTRAYEICAKKEPGSGSLEDMCICTP